MPTATTTGSVLEDLRSRRSSLQKEIEKLITERDRLYTEFQQRMDGDGRPSDDEVSRFEARRNHDDPVVRPTDEEIRAFDARINSGPSEDEVRQFNVQHTDRKGQIKAKMADLNEVDDRVEEQISLNHSTELAQRASKNDWKRVEAQREAMTYRQDNQNQYSYFLDLAAMQNMEVRSTPDPRLEGFRDRLDRHAKEMADVLPQRWTRRKAEAEERVENAENEWRARMGMKRGGFEVSPFERQAHMRSLAPGGGDEYEQRAPSRIVGQGGLSMLAAVAA